MIRSFTACLLASAALLPMARAQFDFSFATEEQTTSQARLVPEAKVIAPGQTFTVALELKHPPRWHSYYKNSGGIEQSPSIEWTLPEGFSAAPIQWPTPEVKEGYGGMSFIYSGSPVFLVDLTAPASLQPGESVTLEAKAAWQICEQSCIDEGETFTLTLPVAAQGEADGSQTAFFTKARAALPVSPSGWKFSATSSGNEVQLRVRPAPGATLSSEGLEFVPNEPFLQPLSAGGKVIPDGDDWLLVLARKTVDFLDQPIEQGNSFSGILSLAGGPALAVPSTTISSPPPAPLPPSKYLPILGGMLLGGLILNLMPCVFPVIGLKIMGFVQQAGQDRKKIAVHGLLFAVGVLLSFGVLSGILLAAREAAARSGGDAIGWGYQLQNPWVVLALLLLLFVLALNMFGVFEIGASATSVGGSLQAKQGLSGSFFSGVLATVVATPCSAPFLGAAIGAAIALPSFQFFAAFAAMAIGLALPYLILSLFPDLLRILPRPGAWMESFKQGMSFLLFATAGYLLWVYAGQIGLEHLLSVVFGLSAIAVAAWIYGRWNLPHRKRAVRGAALLCTALFAAAGLFLSKPPQASASGITWEPWSQQRVDELLSQGRPVYIDFTAQWCLTCQVNKKRAYTKEVVQLMQQKGVVALKADKTNPDPAIDAKLKELGRSAIPVNVLLAPEQTPVITPELLSPGYLLELFGKI